MSHYTAVKMKLQKRSCIVKALEAMGFKRESIEVSDEPLPLLGYQGDTRKQRANIRLKGAGWYKKNVVGSMSNDLGFERVEDGSYIFHVSEYDQHKYNKKWQDKFMNEYARAVVHEHCEENNFFVTKEEVEEDGTLLIKIQSMF